MIDSDQNPLSTRDRLVDVAAGLLKRHSFGGVSVDDICKAADVRKGTFYHYFPSKVEFVLSAYDRLWSYGKEKLDLAFKNDVPPADRLARYATASFVWQNEAFEKEGKVYGCPIAGAGHEMGAQDDRIRDKTKEIFDDHARYFASALADMPHFHGARARKIENVSCEMFSYALGVLYQAKVANDPKVIQRDLLSGLLRLAGVDEQTDISNDSLTTMPKKVTA